MVRTLGRRAEPQVEVDVRGHRHHFGEPIDDLDAVVEPVRLVELLGRRGILQAPRAVGPHVHLVHLADDAGVEDLLDLAAHRRGVALVAHLRRQVREPSRRLADQPRFPDVVGERLLAVHVLAVRQREVRREHVRVLGGRDHHGVVGLGIVEHLAQVVELLRLREADAGRIQRLLVDVAERDDVLVGMLVERAAAVGPLGWRRGVERQLVEARVDRGRRRR